MIVRDGHLPLKITELGQATNVEVRPSIESLDVFMLHVILSDGSKMVLAAERNAIQSLWSYLLRVLYPRATELSQRVETARQNVEKPPAVTTYRMIAYIDTTGAEVVVVTGMARGVVWRLSLDRERAETLWASLQHCLVKE